MLREVMVAMGAVGARAGVQRGRRGEGAHVGERSPATCPYADGDGERGRKRSG